MLRPTDGGQPRWSVFDSLDSGVCSNCVLPGLWQGQGGRVKSEAVAIAVRLSPVFRPAGKASSAALPSVKIPWLWRRWNPGRQS